MLIVSQHSVLAFLVVFCFFVDAGRNPPDDYQPFLVYQSVLGYIGLLSSLLLRHCHPNIHV